MRRTSISTSGTQNGTGMRRMTHGNMTSMRSTGAGTLSCNMSQRRPTSALASRRRRLRVVSCAVIFLGYPARTVRTPATSGPVKSDVPWPLDDPMSCGT
jgi:hypothetical protein